MFVNHREKIRSNSCIWLTMVVVLLSVLAVSCTKDPLEVGGRSVTPDGRVLVSLSLSVPLSESVQTKATQDQEAQINSLYVIVFDAQRKLSQVPTFATLTTSWTVALAPTKTTQYIYALANLSDLQMTTLDNMAVGTTYDDVRLALVQSDVTADGVDSPFQMCSEELTVSEISPTMGQQRLELKRAVAKIDVKVATSDFELESVTLLTAAKKYTPLPSPVNVSPDIWTGDDAIRYNEVFATDNSIESAIYCYENEHISASPAELLIKGKYNGASTSGYYLVQIIYNNRSNYEIRRNCTYTVNISRVQISGFSSEAEAIEHGPLNEMIGEIVVTDGESRDMISNGIYYLGLSNSECVIYTSEDHDDELIATFAHNARLGVERGTVSVEGDGLTLSGSNPFSTPDGSVQTGDIRVNIGDNFMSGNVIVKLGNLEKSIKITRDATPLSYGGPFNLGDTYIYAKKLQTGVDTDWIKLSPNADASAGDDELDNPGGSIHMQLDVNLKLLGGTDRTCDLICARKNHEGRVRVKVAQYAFDIFEYDGQINNAYVGTFHRWNQVGERVIYMANPGAIWVATVVAGHDFITLAPGGSADPTFETDSPGDAERFPVPGNSTTIINTGNSPILFRVGMRSPLSSANAQPRYGLILVSHAGGTNRIFVRQGEEADYVMRKIDPIDGKSDIQLADRPSAVRFAPFHLTDPNRTQGRADLRNNGGVFVEYPSIGGYHFQANKSFAWSPANISAVGWTEAGVNSDPCPTGYRRVRDGVDGNDGLVIGSEIRQSLWYYPRNGSANSDYYNTIRGAIADGYYDRRPKTEKNVDATYKAIVVGSGIDAAFIGTIIFNPHTNASIFLPASGDRSFSGGTLRSQGQDTFWWTATLRGVNAWYGAMTYFGNNYTFDNYSSLTTNGFPIRCVTEVNP